MSQARKKNGTLGVGAGRTRAVSRGGPVETQIEATPVADKGRIPKSVRYELENALVGLCDVWFEDIKPHLLRNNIKVHVHDAEGHGGGGEGAACGRRPVRDAGCSHLDPGAAPDPQPQGNANCADFCSSRLPTSKAQYPKRRPPPYKLPSPQYPAKENPKYRSYDERDKSPAPQWLAEASPYDTLQPNRDVMPLTCDTAAFHVPPLDLHAINKKNSSKRKLRNKKKGRKSHQNQEIDLIAKTRNKASQTQELSPNSADAKQRSLATQIVNVILHGCRKKVTSPIASQSSVQHRSKSPEPVRLPRENWQRTLLPQWIQQDSVQVEAATSKPARKHSTLRRTELQGLSARSPLIQRSESPWSALRRLTSMPQPEKPRSPSPQAPRRSALNRIRRPRSPSSRHAQRSPPLPRKRQLASPPKPIPISYSVPIPTIPPDTSQNAIQNRLLSQSMWKSSPYYRIQIPSSVPGLVPEQRASLQVRQKSVKTRPAGHKSLSPHAVKQGFESLEQTEPNLPSLHKQKKSKFPSQGKKPNQYLQCKEPFEDDLAEIFGLSHDTKEVKQSNKNSNRFNNCWSFGRSSEEYAGSKKVLPWR